MITKQEEGENTMKTIHSFEHPPHVYDSRSMFWRMNFEMDWIISEIAVQATGIDDFLAAIKSRILNVEKSSNHSGEWIRCNSPDKIRPYLTGYRPAF